MEVFNVTPVFMEIPERDPEKTYAAVRGKNSYLLESSDGGEKVARYGQAFGMQLPNLRVYLIPDNIREEFIVCECISKSPYDLKMILCFLSGVISGKTVTGYPTQV